MDPLRWSAKDVTDSTKRRSQMSTMIYARSCWILSWSVANESMKELNGIVELGLFPTKNVCSVEGLAASKRVNQSTRSVENHLRMLMELRPVIPGYQAVSKSGLASVLLRRLTTTSLKVMRKR